MANSIAIKAFPNLPNNPAYVKFAQEGSVVRAGVAPSGSSEALSVVVTLGGRN